MFLHRHHKQYKNEKNNNEGQLQKPAKHGVDIYEESSSSSISRLFSAFFLPFLGNTLIGIFYGALNIFDVCVPEFASVRTIKFNG